MTTATETAMLIPAAHSAIVRSALEQVAGEAGASIEAHKAGLLQSVGSVMGNLYRLAVEAATLYPEDSAKALDYYRAVCRGAEAAYLDAHKPDDGSRVTLKGLMGESRAATWKQIKSRTGTILAEGYAAKHPTLAGAEAQRREDQKDRRGTAHAAPKAQATPEPTVKGYIMGLTPSLRETTGALLDTLAKVGPAKSDDAELVLLEAIAALRDLLPESLPTTTDAPVAAQG